MKVGQMSIKQLSDEADYLQLCISGLSAREALDKYLAYGKKIPIVLHGDWKKNGASENNLRTRFLDYLEIINTLREHTEVIGFTLHPPTRSNMKLEELSEICKNMKLSTGVDIFVENRSNKSILLSNIEEIIEFSQDNLMTIDIPQLYISCGYDSEKLLEVLTLINKDNIKELHIANIKRDNGHTYVARKLNDGELNIAEIINQLGSDYLFTLEILGGVTVFNEDCNNLKKLYEKQSINL